MDRDRNQENMNDQQNKGGRSDTDTMNPSERGEINRDRDTKNAEDMEDEDLEDTSEGNRSDLGAGE